jgi:hypothetical protein
VISDIAPAILKPRKNQTQTLKEEILNFKLQTTNNQFCMDDKKEETSSIYAGINYYESDKMFDRYPCKECKVSNVPVRVFVHHKTQTSKWLCFNCSQEKKYEEYELLQPFKR